MRLLQIARDCTVFLLLRLTWKHTGPFSGNMSDCRSRGQEFDPGSVPFFRRV